MSIWGRTNGNSGSADRTAQKAKSIESLSAFCEKGLADGEFKQWLNNVAGFAYILEPIPMRNTTGATVHCLFFASQNKTGSTIGRDIFGKYKYMGAI